MKQQMLEYVSSRGEQVRVDRSSGVIRGVKLLGLRSKNGRRYPESTLGRAVGLYEGAKVNVNHPAGDPLGVRDYRDRLGVLRGITLRPGKGLFGDLHYNPKHPLAEQLAWDAEHAAENVGLSHNVLARTAQREGTTVVEAITRVMSVDLVADPATTAGLFEGAHAALEAPETDEASEAVEACEPTDATDSTSKLVEENRALREELAVLRDQMRRIEVREHANRMLSEAGVLDNDSVSESWIDQLVAQDEKQLDAAIHERVELLKQAERRARCVSPRSVERWPLEPAQRETTESFVAAIKRVG